MAMVAAKLIIRPAQRQSRWFSEGLGGNVMDTGIPTREEAFVLLTTYNRSESLVKHALAVEGVMRHFAIKHGEDPEKWGIVGLIHDLDSLLSR